MCDLSTTLARSAAGHFLPGRSGNPAGRPKGARAGLLRAGTRTPSSRRCASSIMARMAYSSFCDTFSMGRSPG